MLRFYRGAAIAAAIGVCGAPALAQTADRPPLGSSMTVDVLGSLPAPSNLYSLLDTVVPDVIADRIDTGGLSAGEPARVGAHGSTWTQTLFTLGDVDITDGKGTGTPLLVPDVETWQRVDVATGIMPIDRDAPGLAIALTPRSPTAEWSRLFRGVVSPPALNAAGDLGEHPSITRLNTWLHGELIASGPVARPKVGLFSMLAATRSTHFERDSPSQIDANVASGFAHVVGMLRPADQLHVIGWMQRSRAPVANHRAIEQPNAGEQDVAVHVQSSWEHAFSRGHATGRLFAGVSERQRKNNIIAHDFLAVERLRDGPIPNLLDVGPGMDRTWSLGGRFHTTRTTGRPWRLAAWNDLVGGFDITRASETMQSTLTGDVGELVDGIPARLWTFDDPAEASHWRSMKADLFVSDTVALTPRLTANAGVRIEALSGSRQGASGSLVSWHNVLPRAGAHMKLMDFWQLAAFGQYGRYGHRLPLSDLAYGDPTAPTASVFPWSAPVGTRALDPRTVGPLVQRVGPGTNGDPRFSVFDPNLRRPVMSELILGLETRPHRLVSLRIAAIGRREHPLIGVVDVGVPPSSYTTIGIFDTGVDLVGSGDDQTLIFFNRAPSTFGADRYLLTNPAGDDSSFVGADVSARMDGSGGFLLAGVTAGRSEAYSANRGFGPLENDAGVLGEVYVNPNALGHAQGRVFTERGYTIKIAGGGKLRGVDAAMIARYQDGQHFARLVIMDGLNQGAEAVRAFRNGRTRFTYSMTVDMRLQKAFAIRGRPMTALVDIYNLLNQSLEVEEFSVTGATSRLTSAVQPPRVIQVGFRIPL